jgi:hypothetical protein
MQISVEIDEIELKRMVVQRIQDLMPGSKITEKDVQFLVMTKVNYRATEWENGKFKATVGKFT